MNIQQETRTRDMTMEKRLSFLFIDILDAGITQSVDAAPFYKFTRLLCYFFVDHPIILDGVG